MRIGRIIPVVLSAVSLAAAPVAAQAADSAPVPARVASAADNPRHLANKNTMLVVALLAVTVGVIFLVKGHPHEPAPPVSP